MLAKYSREQITTLANVDSLFKVSVARVSDWMNSEHAYLPGAILDKTT